ncbi:GtrA family protein [Alicyclobacillus sp.]|uniref:GtrA family protein n=1 Tax=Alicyclobacillus sp. TaxID=61169 RepID=UPI0025C648A7|nr:GtrA family protein [Alicyclobacillus sp.]MCL6516135.1 GtrA family protein [Alicyclobacillus sp.]
MPRGREGVQISRGNESVKPCAGPETNRGTGRQWATDFLRFAGVGCLNTGVDLLVFLALIRLAHAGVIGAQAVAYMCGVANSHVWNRRVTFRRTGATVPGTGGSVPRGDRAPTRADEPVARTSDPAPGTRAPAKRANPPQWPCPTVKSMRPSLGEVLRFGAVNTITCLVAVGLLRLAVVWGGPVLIAKLAATGVAFILNFLGNRLWVFASPSAGRRGEPVSSERGMR